MKKLFISQPMNGKTDDEILAVKMGTAVANVSGSDASACISTVNALLASLRSAGIIANG